MKADYVKIISWAAAVVLTFSYTNPEKILASLALVLGMTWFGLIDLLSAVKTETTG